MNRVIVFVWAMALSFGSFLYPAGIQEAQKNSDAHIQMIRNLAAYKIFVKDKKTDKKIEVAPKENVELSSGVKIPFISIKEYMKQFVKNTPYVPGNALNIGIPEQGLFFLWECELGIICAPNPKNINSMGEWKTRVLIEPKKSLPLSVLRLLLLIDKKGKICLENCE